MERHVMDVRRVVGWVKGHRNVLVVAALISLFAGADLLVNRPKDIGVQWFSIPLLGVGIALLALVFWPTAKPGPRPPGDTLAHRFLWWATWRGRIVPMFPVCGVAIVLLDLAYNAVLSPVPELLLHDQVVIALGLGLIAYRFVPERYERERDFAFLFVLALAVILVVPLVMIRLAAGDWSESVDVYSSVALAPETSAILNLLGIRNEIVYDPSLSAPGLAFSTASGQPVRVFITSACSGIYSFAIFASAFTGYVFTEQRRFTRRVVAFFLLGVFFAYLANVLRMVVIVLVGYHFDSEGSGIQNMLFAHSNAGWIIFLAWISLFWFLLFRYLPRESPGTTEAPPEPRKRGAFCGICGIVLTPAIPATICRCGRIYHVECLAAEGKCPECAAPLAMLSASGQAPT